MRQRQRAAAITIAGKPHPDFPGNYLPPHDSAYELHQAIIKSGKKGRAEASFWFHGATTNGMVRVLYLLKLFGTFDNPEDWPSAQKLTMTDWELTVENEGKKIKGESCSGDGDAKDLTITVMAP